MRSELRSTLMLVSWTFLPVSLVRAQQVTLSPEPLARVSGENVGRGLTIGRVAGAIFVRDTLIVADAAEMRLLVIAASGQLVRTIGAKGAGPSEFQAIGSVANCGSQILTWDPVLGRFSKFETDGRLLATFITPIQQIVDVSCSSSGTLGLVKMLGLRSEAAETNAANVDVVTMRADVYLVPAEGSTRKVADNISYGKYLRLGGGAAPVPGLARPAIGFTGSSLALVPDTPDSVEFFSVEGARRAIAVPKEPLRPLSPQAYRTIVERWSDKFPVAVRDKLATLVAAAPIPRYFPWQEAMATDSQGRIWLARSASGATGTHLRVFSPDGQDVGQVDLSSTLQLLAVGSSLVVFQRELDYGDLELVIYSFRGSASR